MQWGLCQENREPAYKLLILYYAEKDSVEMDVPVKLDTSEIIDRHKRFFACKMTDEILITINSNYADDSMPHPRSFAPNMEKVCSAYKQIFEFRKNLGDDNLPVMWANYGAGLMGGFLGADVFFENGTSWSQPILKELDDINKINFTRESQWAIKVDESNAYFMSQSQSDFFVGASLIGGPGDIAYALCGPRIYADVYDNPTAMHSLLQKVTYWLIKRTKNEYSRTSQNTGLRFYPWELGGFCCNEDIAFLSDDGFGACSAPMYEDFALPYAQQFIDAFDGGIFHLHSASLHILPSILKIKGIRVLQFSQDPKVKSPYEMRFELRRQCGDLPLLIDVFNVNEFCSDLECGNLPGGIMYRLSNVKWEDAQNLIYKARSYKNDR